MLSTTPEPIELKELIERVKEELLRVHDTSDPLLAITGIELEISFTVDRSASGGINIHVLQSGVEKAKSEVQTVRVSLEPLATIDQIRDDLSEAQLERIKRRTLRSE